MAKVATFPLQPTTPTSPTRGLRARTTRFANDVQDFCAWYLTGTHRTQQAKVTEYVRYLQRRARQAGSTR